MVTNCITSQDDRERDNNNPERSKDRPKYDEADSESDKRSF